MFIVRYQACDMSEEMKGETVEVIITACEKFGSDYFVRILLFINIFKSTLLLDNYFISIGTLFYLNNNNYYIVFIA